MNNPIENAIQSAISVIENDALTKAAMAAATATAGVTSAEDILETVAGLAGGTRTVTVSGEAVPEGMLRFVSLNGEEQLSRLFVYHVQLKAPDALNLGYFSPAANIPLKPVVGKSITFTIELAEGGVRHISGLVTQCRNKDHSGREVVYELIVEPWLVLATRTSDYKIFQNKTVVGIIDAVLADYPYEVEKRLTEEYPKRSFQVQYGESDYQFIQRLMEEFGIYYFFEHTENGHKLVLADAMGTHKPCPEAPVLSLMHESLKIDREYVQSFTTSESLRSGQWVLDDFDFKNPGARLDNTVAMPRETGHPDFEHYEWPGDYFDKREGAMLTRIRMEAQKSLGCRAQGDGNIRTLLTGHTFTLENSPNTEANREYLILAASFMISETGSASGQDQQLYFHTSFELQPTSEVFRPQRSITKPRTRGPQTAIVTGPDGQEIWTDPYGRVKVQFQWDRYGQMDENSSCWIRVSQPWAGTTYGGIQIPRIGQEVIVDFKNGDPDLPVIIGRFSNANNMPNWNLPSQQALMGFESKELGGSGYSHLIMDDTPQQIQTQLSCTYRTSQLNLGYITRIPGPNGRQDFRGEGFELRTDAWGAIRADKGLLISTYGREGAARHHKDLSETSSALNTAHALHQTYADAAAQCSAQEAGKDQADIATAIEHQNNAIQGQGGQQKELAEPQLVISSPDGIAVSSAKTIHLASATNVAVTTGENLSIVNGKSLFASVAEKFSLFVHKLGIKLIAANSDIDIQALKNSINLLAKLEITQTAERIHIRAKEELMLEGGGSYSRWNGIGIEHGTMGGWVEHAASHSMPGPRNVPTPELSDKSICIECLLKAAKSGTAIIPRL